MHICFRHHFYLHKQTRTSQGEIWTHHCLSASTSFQPAIVSQQRTGEADQPALEEEQEPDGNCQSEPSSLDLNFQDKMLENRSLLEEVMLLRMNSERD